MKKFLLFVFAIFFFATVHSQNCSDIFISEVVFGIDTMQSSNTIIKNYSVELFNPTNQPIDLTDYSFKLVSDNGTITNIQLSGIIESKMTYVISYDQSGADLYLISDMINSSLNFDNKKVLELLKNTTVIDMVGKYGLANSDTIDLLQAIGDPAAYLNALNFDFRSLQKLTFRRNPTVQKGDLLFADPSHQWFVFDNNQISDIDYHLCVCKGDVIFGWDSPYYSVNEGFFVYLKVNADGFDGSSIVDVSAYQIEGWTPPPFSTPVAYANSTDDVTPTIAMCNFYSLPDYLLPIYCSNDPTPEPDETLYYQLQFPNGGTVDLSREYTELVINESDAFGINDINESETFLKTFPNPVTDKLFIRFLDNKSAEKITLYDMLGNKVYETISQTTVIFLNKIPTGIYLLYINVGYEIFTKRISKI